MTLDSLEGGFDVGGGGWSGVWGGVGAGDAVAVVAFDGQDVQQSSNAGISHAGTQNHLPEALPYHVA
jgi:hypothetical protein